MAIDFPSNPTNGQVYGNYIYDSSITAWRNVNTDTGIGTLNAMGLKNVVPTSVVVGSGSATTNANGTVTFSGASSISLNGVFTTTYQNYRVIFTPSGSSAQNTVYLRMRASGVDTSSSSYNFASSAMRDSNVSFGLSGSSIAAFWLNYYNGPGSGQGTGTSIVDIVNPKNVYTTATWVSRGSDGTSAFYLTGAGTLYSGNYDGITILPSTGTFNGTMTVYGYTK